MEPCPSGKVQHFTETEAEARLSKIWRKGRGVLPTRTYLCNRCNAWHLTKRPFYGRRHKKSNP